MVQEWLIVGRRVPVETHYYPGLEFVLNRATLATTRQRGWQQKDQNANNGFGGVTVKSTLVHEDVDKTCDSGSRVKDLRMSVEIQIRAGGGS